MSTEIWPKTTLSWVLGKVQIPFKTIMRWNPWKTKNNCNRGPTCAAWSGRALVRAWWCSEASSLSSWTCPPSLFSSGGRSRPTEWSWPPPQEPACSSQVWSLTQFYPVDFLGQNLGSVKKSAFSTNTKSRFASAVFDGVLGTPHLARHTWQCPCISVAPEAMHKASQVPLKGAMSAQKARQATHETEIWELLGGTEENSVSPMRGHWFALQENQQFFT